MSRKYQTRPRHPHTHPGGGRRRFRLTGPKLVTGCATEKASRDALADEITDVEVITDE